MINYTLINYKSHKSGIVMWFFSPYEKCYHSLIHSHPLIPSPLFRNTWTMVPMSQEQTWHPQWTCLAPGVRIFGETCDFGVLGWLGFLGAWATRLGRPWNSRISSCESHHGSKLQSVTWPVDQKTPKPWHDQWVYVYNIYIYINIYTLKNLQPSY